MLFLRGWVISERILGAPCFPDWFCALGVDTLRVRISFVFDSGCALRTSRFDPGTVDFALVAGVETVKIVLMVVVGDGHVREGGTLPQTMDAVETAMDFQWNPMPKNRGRGFRATPHPG